MVFDSGSCDQMKPGIGQNNCFKLPLKIHFNFAFLGGRHKKGWLRLEMKVSVVIFFGFLQSQELKFVKSYAVKCKYFAVQVCNILAYLFHLSLPVYKVVWGFERMVFHYQIDRAFFYQPSYRLKSLAKLPACRSFFPQIIIF